jgi:HNH endonuclease
MAGRKAATVRQRFDEKVAPPDENGCRLWLGGRTRKTGPKGYGVFYVDGQMRPAHRWALEQAIGKLPPSIDACHRCDVRLCVTVEHLFPGTRTENMQDAIRKGRTSHAMGLPGERHHMARLTEKDVRQVRELHAAGWPMRDLSQTFAISFAHVSRIINHLSWRHLT